MLPELGEQGGGFRLLLTCLPSPTSSFATCDVRPEGFPCPLVDLLTRQRVKPRAVLCVTAASIRTPESLFRELFRAALVCSCGLRKWTAELVTFCRYWHLSDLWKDFHFTDWHLYFMVWFFKKFCFGIFFSSDYLNPHLSWWVWSLGKVWPYAQEIVWVLMYPLPTFPKSQHLPDCFICSSSKTENCSLSYSAFS